MARLTRLELVKDAADKAASARRWLETTIRNAHAEGQSLRAIADAAGLSHEQVRRIVSR